MIKNVIEACNCCESCKKYYADRGIFGTNVAVDNNGRAYRLQPTYTEFDWGCNGKGSEALARSILADFAGLKVADRWYQDFIHDFIACLPVSGFTIPGEAIREWLEDKVKGA